ncbi:sigma-54 interaction domain-containing protein [Papillibacter cinnamivorans]|uniref:HTH-type transcriptional regulatory protein TyrR n=1 Tax=Papillibacter cinnamivorans DSM 12816 TaxID=1122930 RepID=A0A1W1YWP5_9FIRM|nr:sigma 54-interacting transcriptional regulator [Papillibacter cinnamivorans]SMC40637.1 PAS domain S-box-containing protein [Papillibacter cinnamivorans DSM 12816]
MKDVKFFETILDNMTDGIYILDDKGNYIFVNSKYVNMTGISKTRLLRYNVYDFLKEGQIKVLISDIVYRNKNTVNMLQNVDISGGKHYQQLVISTPIFDEKGNVRNILAICRDVTTMNDSYRNALLQGVISNYDSYNMEGEKTSDAIISESVEMKNLLDMAKYIAQTDSAVLLYGESGTGKEVVANYIHSHSPRGKNKMVIVNCASLPENLLEAELFGYEKGAFTGAAAEKRGIIEDADHSTLFLDEINSLPLNLQGKLLRALETKQIIRLGSNKTRFIDFRTIAATNEELQVLVEKKQFRADLFYRLNVIPMTIPTLRDRQEDIVPLAEYFLRYYCGKYGKSRVLTEKTIQNMLNYNWPGNVRELKNFIERAVVMSAGNNIEIGNIQSIASDQSHTSGQKYPAPIFFDMSGHSQMPIRGISLNNYMAQCERDCLQYVLNSTRSTREAAKTLNTTQSLIMRRKKKYGL